jgi:7-cyano-7-deazaguanine reductase
MSKTTMATDPLHLRRALLAPKAAPRTEYEYIVTLTRALKPKKLTEASATLTLRYIPDRLLLSPPALKKYAAAVEKEPHASLEALADLITGDLHNELIPLFLEVELVLEEDGTLHRVLRQERQPDWDNPGLLARLHLF